MVAADSKPVEIGIPMYPHQAKSRRTPLTVIGLGNEMLSDDGVGIRVVRGVRERISTDHASFEELSVGGIELFDYLVQTDECIIVDAILTGQHPPGTIVRFVQSADEEPVRLTSSHQIDLGQILGLAKFLGASLPSRTTVYGIEAADITTFREECTEAVSNAIPELVDVICDDIRNGGVSGEAGTHGWHEINVVHSH